MADTIKIGGELESKATGNIVAAASAIKDKTKNEYQSSINSRLDEDINAEGQGLKDRTTTLEQQVSFSGDFQAENTPAGIIAGSGKIAAANAVRGAIDVRTGYFECDTVTGTAAKTVTAAGYVLTAGGSIKIKMLNANRVDNATLNINSTGAKALYYAGERASATNSWDAEEVVEIYYDGTSYYANNVKGGSGSGVYDVSKEHPTSGPNSDGKFTLEYILNSSNVNELIPVNKRYPGMFIQFVSTSDNKYVQYRYMGTSIVNTDYTNVVNWQAVDIFPRPLLNSVMQELGGVLNVIFDKDLALDFSVDGKLFDVNGGIINVSGAKLDPNYYIVIPGLVIETNLKSAGYGRSVVYYDYNKSFLSAVKTSGAVIKSNVPQGCYYVRFSTENYNASRYAKISSTLLTEPFDVSAYNNNTTYQSLAAALSANIPNKYKVGGVNIRFINSNSLEYEQWELISQTWSDNVNDWRNSKYALYDIIRSLSKVIDIEFNDLPLQQGLYTSTGTVINTTGNLPNYRYCKTYFPVISGNKIIVTAYAIGTARGVVFYNSDFTVNSYSSGGTNKELTVPTNACYVRICTETYQTKGLSIILKGQNIDNTPTEGSENLVRSGGVFAFIKSSNENMEDSILKRMPIAMDFSVLKAGLLNNTGSPTSTSTTNPDYKYCETYFRVEEGQILHTNAYAVGSARGICFYDSSKEFQSAKGFSNEPITIGEGIKFVRFSTEKYTTRGLEAYIDEQIPNPYLKKINVEIGELDSRVDAVENVVSNNQKECFEINKDAWIADEVVKSFNPNTTRIEHKYLGEVNPSKRYVALGFDDFRASDFSLIMPLLEKYNGRAEFNRVHRTEDASNTDIKYIKDAINGNHEIGDHTWLHYKYPFFEPLFNGQDPSAPDGSQVPFPSNSQLRDDTGSGKNAFGRPLTENIKTALGYQAPDLDTTWGALTDSECQYFRDYFSVMKDTDTNLITILDTMSNKYLGTTGNSRESWDSTDEEYKGGIFTGCKTSQNHEIWERILLVTNMYLKDVFGLNYNLKTWSMPGSKASGCYFVYDNISWYDASHTQRYGNLAKFESSLYKNQDGTSKLRSWTDVLRGMGYIASHDTSSPASRYCMSYQLIMNGRQSRIDALESKTNHDFSYSDITTEYVKGTDLLGTEPFEVQMYDDNRVGKPHSFKKAIETWRQKTANGIVWGEVIDSSDTWSERMILEGLFKFASKAGIELITKAEAFDICFNHRILNGNLFYNPTFRNTAKEFMPTAATIPDNPDGFAGDCSVSIIDNIPVLVIGSNGASYEHFGIPYGRIKVSMSVKGNGNITLYEIKNNTLKTDLEAVTNLNIIATINATDDSQFVTKEIEFDVLDYGVSSDSTDQQLFEGHGNKVIGAKFVFGAGLSIKNMNMKLV